MKKAFRENRPLYVNYSGKRCVCAWYSRAWVKMTGTGGHVARNLAYDGLADWGENGLMYGKTINHHKSEKIVETYRTSFARGRAIASAQDALIQISSAD